MSQHTAASLAIEVEIGVVGQVDDCRGVTLGREGETELVLLAPFISCNGLQIARIAHFTILCDIEEFHGPVVHTAFPNLVLEALGTSVQVVRPVVHRQFVFLSVKDEASLCYAVGKASRDLACARSVGEVVQRIAVAEYHVVQFPVTVWYLDGHYSRTHGRELYGCAFCIGESVADYVFAARGLAPDF